LFRLSTGCPSSRVFAQQRALGRKVSDEFTVPLCRIHHREFTSAVTNSHGGKTAMSIQCLWRSDCEATQIKGTPIPTNGGVDFELRFEP
jgi:hypothetical protein